NLNQRACLVFLTHHRRHCHDPTSSGGRRLCACSGTQLCSLNASRSPDSPRLLTPGGHRDERNQKTLLQFEETHPAPGQRSARAQATNERDLFHRARASTFPFDRLRASAATTHDSAATLPRHSCAL